MNYFFIAKPAWDNGTPQAWKARTPRFPSLNLPFKFLEGKTKELGPQGLAGSIPAAGVIFTGIAIFSGLFFKLYSLKDGKH